MSENNEQTALRDSKIPAVCAFHFRELSGNNYVLSKFLKMKPNNLFPLYRYKARCLVYDKNKKTCAWRAMQAIGRDEDTAYKYLRLSMLPGERLDAVVFTKLIHLAPGKVIWHD